jgi:hypothetical protein
MSDIADRHDLADTLREMEWGHVWIGQQVAGQICPACSCVVAPGMGAERSHREQHIISLHSR